MSKIHESIETANKYIEAAIEKLDTLHGADFAKANPQILSALVQSAIAIRTGEILNDRIENIANQIAINRFEG